MPHELDFEIRCDDFNVTFYDTGMAKEYRSKLSIINDSSVILQKDIIVNDPLRYEGINLFQSYYGIVPPNEITLNFEIKKSEKIYTKKVAMGNAIHIPETDEKFIPEEFTKSFHIRGHDLGPSVIGTLLDRDNEPQAIVLPLNHTRFDVMRNGDTIISFKDFDRAYYTGLQVTSDPGVPVVYFSFITMLIGFYITFFMSHKRLFVQVLRQGNKSQISLYAFSNKNKLDMENKAKRIAKNLIALNSKLG